MSRTRKTVAGLSLIALLAACWPGGEDGAAADLLPPDSSFTVLQIDELAAPEGTTLLRDAEGGVSGQAPCNRYTGQMTREGDTLRFGPIAMTRMACLDQGRSLAEARFAAALADVATITAGAEPGQVALVDEAGKVRIVLAAKE